MFLNPETNEGCHVEMLYVRMVPAPPVLLLLRRLDSNQCGGVLEGRGGTT